MTRRGRSEPPAKVRLPRRCAGAWIAAFLVVAVPSRLAGALTWPDVADRVERDLSAVDVGTRRAAARQIGALGRARGGPLALAALGDSDDDVRLAAARAAIRLRVAQASDLVVPWLNAPDAHLRLEACAVVKALPSPRTTIAPLARTLGDPDAEVRLAAAEALGHQQASEAVPPLLGRLDDSTPLVRVAVVEALGRLDDPRAVVPLVGKVDDSSPDVRRAVVRALGDLGDVRASPALVLTLRDQTTEVRREALVALGRLHAADAVDAIAPFASDRDAPLRLAALGALGRLATPEALRILTNALGSADDSEPSQGLTPLREALVDAGPAAIAPLCALLAASPAPAAASSAAWVLGELHAHAAAGAIVSALRRGALPAAAALHALAGAGTAAEVPVVLEYLTDDSPAVRDEAADAAFALLDPDQPDGRALEPLAAALRDSRPSNAQRARIVEAIGRTGAPRAARVLANLVTAPDERLRLAAIDALGWLGSGDADDVLVGALSSAEPAVRLHAATTLSEAGGTRARDVLLARLNGGGDEIDRAAALTALGGILSRLPAERAIAQLSAGLDLTAGPERDALIEALGRAPAAAAVEALAGAARSDEPFDRQQAAVLCAAQTRSPQRGDALGVLRRLLDDPDPAVRAQAAWSLGTLGDGSDAARLAALAGSTDGDLAADATAALARVGARVAVHGPARAPDLSPTLCAIAADARPFVRANALAGLALAGRRCASGAIERSALAGDPSEDVRAAAALAVAVHPSADDVRALDRCAQSDVSSAVASRCRSPRSRLPTRSQSVLVYVVPAQAEAPRPGAPYALLMADGLIHAGRADRRGAVFDPAAPQGSLRLVSVSSGPR